jgi:hypothetical protein
MTAGRSDIALVTDLARHLRQATRTCSAHSVGPVAAFARCAEARRTGQISPDEFRQVGMATVELCSRVLEEATSEDARRREQRIIEFVSALFGLEEDA